MRAAEFLMAFEDQEDLALDYARKSTDLHRHFLNWWVRAQLEAAKGDYVTAVASAQRAAALGFGNDNEAYEKEYKLMIENKITEWKGMNYSKWEVGSGKWEVGSRKWEVGSRKSEVGSRKNIDFVGGFQTSDFRLPTSNHFHRKDRSSKARMVAKMPSR